MIINVQDNEALFVKFAVVQPGYKLHHDTGNQLAPDRCVHERFWKSAAESH